ncbi:hypothetical protein K8374_25435 (plasmid) [Pseudomonas sp. p1(2021b)]|uniref:hypothetical protein n=1 Tax=Pseudomonas sp. p1(2021b) TaxID=2874628 RepID=UPI001CCADB02|nr:hypothetical protein [Pseudomonas sp. p1(2021b)]UBM27851.1 hypothetical protein K8374_25435 [Pseudomonas sp. p1(2021b)]
MQYKVNYQLGDKKREAIMAQIELDECRNHCEVIEAVDRSCQQTSASVSPSEIQEDDGWTEFSYGGKRWSFDSDQLAQWDEELKYFDFLDYHLLINPTIESVTAFIHRQDY